MAVTRIILTTFVLLLSLQSAHAQAVVVSVSPAPATVRVNPGGSTAITLRWTIRLNFFGPAAETVSSASGVTSTGVTLGGNLSKRVPSPGAGQAETITLTERLFIDRTTAEGIGAAGPSTYTRSFGSTVATNGPIPGAISLQPSSGGSLSIRNLELIFDDDSRFAVVESGDALNARLEISSLGRGSFAGRWEVSGPTGSAAFRPIGRVSRRLSGAVRTVFESPNLRTDRPGLYQVRFVPEAVTPGLSPTPLEVISYSVVEPDAAEPAAKNVNLLSPPPGFGVKGATRFAWQPVPGAARYRVEFSRTDAVGLDRDFLAAIESRQTSALLRQFTLRRLNTETRLFWYVVAFDGAGAPIAVSSKRQLK
ncbi:MAG: hypothetical protein AAF066_13995 [Pseudomonadota bacterium]